MSRIWLTVSKALTITESSQQDRYPCALMKPEAQKC